MAIYAIIGGVAGGASAAARLRRLDEKAEIILFERGHDISYANCGLPYYIGGVIEERENLFVQTPETFAKRFNIDVHVLSEVQAIDRNNKRLTVKDLKSGELNTFAYDKLVLSPGAAPIVPPLEGIHLDEVFTLRNVSDTDRIYKFLEKEKPKSAIIVGAGFIGLEMAENLVHRGLNVGIVEMLDQVLAPLDFSMAALVHEHLQMKNVGLFLGDPLQSISKKGKALEIKLKSGKVLYSEMIVLSIGVKPEVKLARESGLELGERGHIKVNEYLQSSDPDIFSVGDAIEFPHPILKSSFPVYLAGPANKQARMAADNIVKNAGKKWPGAIGTAIAKVFDLSVAVTGLSAKQLEKHNIDYLTCWTHSSSHAGYYPGAGQISLKLQFSAQDGRLYGAQAVGFDGVDSRINMIAALLQKQGTIYDLQLLEQAYAPPYSSAKDPVNIAAYVAENMINGDVRFVDYKELEEMEDKFILGVVTEDEHELKSIPGAVNIPLNDLRNRLTEVPKDKNIIVYCGVGLRAYVACRILMQNAYEKVYNLAGGLKTWTAATARQSFNGPFQQDGSIPQQELRQEKEQSFSEHDDIPTVEVDSCGLQCPGPIMRLKQEMDKISPGQRIRQKASDPGFYRDVEAWCSMTGNRLIDRRNEKGVITAIVEKSSESLQKAKEKNFHGGGNKTLVVFSDDLDKALASFVIANGAASTGKKVTMFFTFWGLSVLKKAKKGKGVKRDFMARMFGMMLPRGSKKLGLSKMNMGGMGAKMMRGRMNKKNIDSLEAMIKSAAENGVQLVACQMSMDVMGVAREDLIDEVTIGGVASYLAEAEQADVNLFI